LSIAPARFTSTGGLFKGVVTGKLTRADLAPNRLGAASEKFTVTEQVPDVGIFGLFEHVSGPRVKSAALIPVIVPAPSAAMLTVSGFVIVTVIADVTAGF
jgi:hypothetical protein